jgi:protein Jumonji
MALSAFYRIARNTMSMWFKDSPSASEVETEFWKHVSNGQSHICVHSGSIDSGTWGYGFPVAKSSSTSRHPWNLKVLTNNSGSILRSIGPLMGNYNILYCNTVHYFHSLMYQNANKF